MPIFFWFTWSAVLLAVLDWLNIQIIQTQSIHYESSVELLMRIIEPLKKGEDKPLLRIIEPLRRIFDHVVDRVRWMFCKYVCEDMSNKEGTHNFFPKSVKKNSRLRCDVCQNNSSDFCMMVVLVFAVSFRIPNIRLSEICCKNSSPPVVYFRISM